MATVKEVAQKAGVSVATVSRVLNGDTAVRPQTRENVLLVMEQLHYRPNLLGRNLRRQNTDSVLILIPTASNPFYSRIITGIEEYFRQRKVAAQFCVTHGEKDCEQIYLTMLQNHRCDGIILLQTAFSSRELAEATKGLPVVQCCEFAPDTPLPCVGIDNEKAAFDACSALWQRGDRKIAMVSYSEFVETAVARGAGYRRFAKEHNIQPAFVQVAKGGHSFEGAMEAFERLVDQWGMPDGVFCSSDTLAAGVLKATAGQPKRPHVFGFDNTELARVLTPTLSTVEQPRYELGQTAAAMLEERIADPRKKSTRVLLPYRLILRESTD